MAVPSISRPTLWFFRRLARRYFRRQFDAVRIGDGGRAGGAGDGAGDGPLIVYANHGSWWDPMVSIVLAERYWPGRQHFAPMDAGALLRYGILRRIGVFPVEMKTARGAAQFLRTGGEILAAGGVLWVTPQGRFADARAELDFKPGLAALAARVPGGCTVLPLAIEYVFWDERLPETLLQWGEPVRVRGETAAEVDGVLRERLAEAMSVLREKAMARNAGRFDVLVQGRRGAGGFYELGKWLSARVRGQAYRPGHGQDVDEKMDEVA